MKHIDLKDAAPGMIIAEEVTDGSGNVLLKVGTELSERTPELLEKRGVDKVFIESEADHISPEQLQEETRKLAKRMSELFKGRLDDAVMAGIMKAAFHIKLKKLRH